MFATHTHHVYFNFKQLTLQKFTKYADGAMMKIIITSTHTVHTMITISYGTTHNTITTLHQM